MASTGDFSAIRRAGALLLCAWVAGCAAVSDPAETASLLGPADDRGVGRVVDRLSPFPDPEVYQIEFRGVDAPPAVLAVLERASRAVAGRRGEPVDALALQRLAERDVARLERALRSEGYFEGRVAADVEPTTPLATIVFDIDAGPRFRIAEHRFVADREIDLTETGSAAAALLDGAPARSEDILAAEAAAVATLQAAGYAYATLNDRDAVADLEADTLSIESRLSVGPRATVERIEIDGADTVRAEYILGFLTDLVGGPASPDLFAERAAALRATGLFRRVAISLPETPPEMDGPTPVLVAVDEAAHRAIGAGLRFETDAGPGARAFWEHRNLFGAAETLRVELDVALAGQSLDVTLRRPRAPSASQTMLAALAAESVETEAYDRIGVAGSLGLEHAFDERMRGGVGLAFDLSEIDADGASETSLLFGAPVWLAIDQTDAPLDPADGRRIRVSIAPYVGEVDQDARIFVIAEGRLAEFQRLDAEGRFVAVGRGRIAVIATDELDDVPRNYRLYSGGGRSVRAFAAQRVGPLDGGGDPTGGLTAAEAGLELRIRVADGIDLAPFFDVGVVGADAFSFDDAEVQGGPGVGVRYVSPIGVIRGDVATPIDPRADDAPVQLYIGVGQEF